MEKERKPNKRKWFKRILIIFLIFLLFFVANMIAGGYALIMQHQRDVNLRLDRLELQMDATRQAYRANQIELEQRVTALEQRPTYREPVTHKKVQEPKKVEEVPVKEHNPFKAPTLDPLIPLTGIFTLFGMLKMSSPVGG